MNRFCLDRTLALALYAGFAACGDGGLQPCDPSPDPIVGAPRITSMSPTSGPPGTTVTLIGAGFEQQGVLLEASYGDYSLSCDHGIMEGTLVSDTEITVIIPEQANLPGYIYLLADGLTVTKSPSRFEMDVPATVIVDNQSQFPIVTVSAGWDPILELGDRIDVEETRALEVESGPLHLELCTGDRDASGAVEPWACVVHDTRAEPAESIEVTVAKIPAARFLQGEWIATWNISEEETDQERLRIDGDGYWEIRYGTAVVESGDLIEPAAWAPYARDFSFGLRAADPSSETSVPVRSFTLLSPRAGDRVAFYRAE